MRLALIVAALCGFSCIASANTITQVFPVTYQDVSQTEENSNGFLQFDTQLGTLNSVRADFSGNLLFAPSAPDGRYTINFGGFAGGGSIPSLFFSDTASEMFQTDVPVDPGSITGINGFADHFLAFIDLSVQDGTVLTGSTALGSLTYNYTPAASTPEPSSDALLGTGLLAAAGVIRKRRAETSSPQISRDGNIGR